MLKIYTDETNYLELPETMSVDFGGEQVYTEVVMASGKRVRDVVGYRRVIKVTYKYLPADKLMAIHNIVEQCGYAKCEMPGIGEDISEYFSITPPVSTICRFINGVPCWTDATITLTAQEVV